MILAGYSQETRPEHYLYNPTKARASARSRCCSGVSMTSIGLAALSLPTEIANSVPPWSLCLSVGEASFTIRNLEATNIGAVVERLHVNAPLKIPW